MPAYWIARSKINDPVAYKRYTDRVPAIIAKFGGKVLARGGRYQILEGPEKFHRFVVIEFPDFGRCGGLSEIARICRGFGASAKWCWRSRTRHRRKRRCNDHLIERYEA